MPPTPHIPYMPLWVYDLEADEDCALMSLSEYGAYIRLLQRQWIEGSIPADPTRLARLLRVTDDQFDKIWSSLTRKFEKDGRGRLKNRRLDEVKTEATAKVEKNRRNGAKGGRPKRSVTDGQTQEKPNGLPNGSIRASASVSDSEYSRGDARGVPIPDALDSAAFREKWGEWLAYRRASRFPSVTEGGAKRSLAKLARSGEAAAIAAIDDAMANEYQGLHPKSRPTPPPKPGDGIDREGKDTTPDELDALYAGMNGGPS